MTGLPRFDDLSALAEIAAYGFDPWCAPVVIGPAQAEAFCRTVGIAPVPEGIPGAMLQSMLPVLVPDKRWQVCGYASAVNLGCPILRFPAVVRPGLPVAGRSRLVEAMAHPRGVTFTVEFEVRAVEADEPCLRSKVQLLYMGPA